MEGRGLGTQLKYNQRRLDDSKLKVAGFSEINQKLEVSRFKASYIVLLYSKIFVNIAVSKHNPESENSLRIGGLQTE